MFKELKLKIATRRLQRKNARKATGARRRTTRKKAGFWARVWDVIRWPFRMIARITRRIWAWIRSIDLIGLVNLTLLIAIIVLFSMLIIDLVGCRKKSVVIVADTPAVAVVPDTPQITVTERAAPLTIKPRRTTTLPVRRDPVTRKFVSPTIVVTHSECER